MMHSRRPMKRITLEIGAIILTLVAAGARAV